MLNLSSIFKRFKFSYFGNHQVSGCVFGRTRSSRYCVDTGLVKAEEPETLVNIQCPCGLVPTYVSYQNGKSGSVRFHSVPAFVFATGSVDEISIPHLESMTELVSFNTQDWKFMSLC